MPSTRSPLPLSSAVVAASVLAVGGVLFCMTPGRGPEPTKQSASQSSPAAGGGQGGAAARKAEPFWQVDDVRPGMKGYGRTVMQGTRVETFQAEVLGVLKNTSPGRDLVLCRLSRLNLEKTRGIAGMRGHPG